MCIAPVEEIEVVGAVVVVIVVVVVVENVFIATSTCLWHCGFGPTGFYSGL